MVKTRLPFPHGKAKFSRLIHKTSEGERWESVEIGRKDDTTRTVLWNSANMQKEITVTIGNDITERKQVEISIRELNLELEKQS
ncbi:MAG: hypothetical protein IPG53_21515 [Ignavibacteriales bacterium]|nr:hypothetical protein [Ignavibacteriales bacterium]